MGVDKWQVKTETSDAATHSYSVNILEKTTFHKILARESTILGGVGSLTNRYVAVERVETLKLQNCFESAMVQLGTSALCPSMLSSMSNYQDLGPIKS